MTDKHDYKGVREAIKSQTDGFDKNFDWSGLMMMFDGKHLGTVLTALRIADKLQSGEVSEEIISQLKSDGWTLNDLFFAENFFKAMAAEMIKGVGHE